jgi:Ni/Fe-hydrogenase subunit HybB-like protein
MKGIIGYFRALLSPQFAPTGIRVALVVGTILLIINHGYAMVSGSMTSDRWLAASLTYLVPYLVNVHGQYSSYRRQQWQKKSEQ